MNKPTKVIVAFTVILLVLVGLIINFKSPHETSTKISIVATNFPAYDFARAVAGDKADIKMLIKPGAEVHTFEPTPQDIIDIENSDLFIYTGGESDTWVETILQNIGTAPTLKMMDAVETLEEDAPDNDSHHNHMDTAPEYDEHVWTSIRNAEKITNRIKDKLIEISPKDQLIFDINAKNYINQLADLDKKAQNIVNNGNRKTIVFGDRFPLRYFANDYNLDYYAAFPGCSEETEASSQTIAFLIDKVKTEKIPVVFKIEMSNGKIADAIAQETGAKVLTFNSAQNISRNDFEAGMTYVMIMEDNLTALTEALK